MSDLPELPEVEVNRQGLQTLVVNKTIQTIECYWDKIFVSENFAHTAQLLQHQTIEAVHRRGKYIIFELTEGYIVSHLRMEGKYFYYLPDEIPTDKDKHTHVIIEFTDDSQLHYHDVRKFGRMEYLPEGALDAYFAQRQLGPEPTREAFQLTTFIQTMQQVKQQIKPALLSQKYVVGLGNIYVDEVLFRSHIHPERRAYTLNDLELTKLHQEIINVIEEAVEAGGSTIRSYLSVAQQDGTYQERLQVYGRKGELCYRCGHPIEKIRVAQRGTHYCPVCQPLERD